MRVLYEAAWSWILLEDENGKLLLDVHCSHGVLDYSVLIELDAEERRRLHEEGRSYLARLSHEVHYSAPAAEGSRSTFKARDLSVTRGTQVTNAVQAWRAMPPG